MTHRELQGMLKQLSEYQVNQLGQIAMRYLTLNQELDEIKPEQCPVCGDQNAKFIRKGIQRGKQRFLSANEYDVKQAIDNDIAAGVIMLSNPHVDPRTKIQQIRIAFDGDAVLFGADSERIYQQKGMEAFMEHEHTKADIPMNKGPFANFLMALSNIQTLFNGKEKSPIRTALVTSRNAPAHERAIKTLRAWNVRVDEAFFLGGVSKKDVLSAYGAHIFFDDQRTHAEPASEVVASAVVPYREGDNPTE